MTAAAAEGMAKVLRKTFHTEPTFGHGTMPDTCLACRATIDALAAAGYRLFLPGTQGVNVVSGEERGGNR